MKLLLHVGMPKCGSSALQTYLSSTAFSDISKTRFVYAAVLETGSVIWGDELIKKATMSPFAYCSSHSGKTLSTLSVRDRGNIVNQLKELGRKYDTVILSNEGWGPNVDHLTDDCLFADSEFDVSVLAYVRPQVDWINSAWWQWGAWVDHPFARWMNRTKKKAEWARLLQEWSAKPWVKKVDVRLTQGDIVQDFMKYIGYGIPAQPRMNQGLPAILLRLFQRNRHLRPGPHDAAIEFVLARHLRMEGTGTPWVIRPRLVEELIDFYAEDNKQLAEMLPEPMRQAMLDEPRWWSPVAYEGKTAGPIETKNLEREALEKLTVAALEAVARMDGEIRKLKSGGAPE